MKRWFFTLSIFLFLNSPSAIAQNQNDQPKTASFFEQVDRFGEYEVLRTLDPNSYKGSPYYNRSFVVGEVFIDKKLIETNAALRYNALTDEIEYKETLHNDQEQSKALLKAENLSAIINKDYFIFIKDKGYFLVLFEGNKLSLLKKISKKYCPPKKATTSLTKDFPAEFKNRFHYYLKDEIGELTLIPTSKRESFFNENEKLKEFIKGQKLDLNNSSNLVKLVTYYDSL